VRKVSKSSIAHCIIALGHEDRWLGLVHTKAGATGRALAAVDRARAALDAPGLHPTLRWFDYYDSIRLDGFATRAHRLHGPPVGRRHSDPPTNQSANTQVRDGPRHP
jgi:hypothetical protein